MPPSPIVLRKGSAELTSLSVQLSSLFRTRLRPTLSRLLLSGGRKTAGPVRAASRSSELLLTVRCTLPPEAHAFCVQQRRQHRRSSSLALPECRRPVEPLRPDRLRGEPLHRSKVNALFLRPAYRNRAELTSAIILQRLGCGCRRLGPLRLRHLLQGGLPRFGRKPRHRHAPDHPFSLQVCRQGPRCRCLFGFVVVVVCDRLGLRQERHLLRG